MKLETLRVYDTITATMGNIVSIRASMYTIWYDVKLDTGKTHARQGKELILGTSPEQWGFATPVYDDVPPVPELTDEQLDRSRIDRWPSPKGPVHPSCY